MPSPDKPTRKLAAIMFTDIVGFTELSARDDEGAFALIEKQREILKPIVSELGGEWLKEMGDGLLLSFPSSKQAVNCAIKIQHIVKEIDDLNLRIGIHQGDILEKDGDIFGDDVNVASRIEPFSATGGVAISHKVQSDISSSPEFETKFISQPSLKGVRQEVKVYCITSHDLPETEITKVTAKLEKDVKKLWFNQKFIIGAIGLLVIAVIMIYSLIPSEKEIPSIGILMMENLGLEEDNFWARGITENLILDVANFGIVKVSPIREILNIGQTQSPSQISERLDVKYLLYSSIYKKADFFDLKCQFIETKTEKALFGEKWNSNLSDVDQVSSDLAKKILKSIGIIINIEETKLINITKAKSYYETGDYLNAVNTISPAWYQAKGATIGFKSDILFEKESLIITEQGLIQLETLIKYIRKSSFPVIIEAHTDNSIPPKIYKDNFDYSNAMALTVLEKCLESGLSKEKIRAIGYADMIPRDLDRGGGREDIISPKTTYRYNLDATNRDRNRRISFHILTQKSRPPN